MKYLITGAAGFVGFHVATELLRAGHRVVGLDSLNDYYDVSLKEARLAQLCAHAQFTFLRHDLAAPGSADFIAAREPDVLIHLAAQPGVRYSIENPQAYADSNLQGFLNVLEGARRCRPQHLLYASSSSVYGSTTPVPFAEEACANQPDSFYAATKLANEAMAYSYAQLYGLPATALRFFTVYGPWGRPDMALYKFALALQAGKAIPVFGDGSMRRDFTYVADAARAVALLSALPPSGTPPHRVVNVGNREPQSVLALITLLEEHLGIPANKQFLPVPPGDVPVTYADTAKLQELTGFVPATPLEQGVAEFAAWFRRYHA
jgi:UDP-glucuronate 4-epimerase